jgi:hypothetical protein
MNLYASAWGIDLDQLAHTCASDHYAMNTAFTDVPHFGLADVLRDSTILAYCRVSTLSDEQTQWRLLKHLL